MTRPTVLDMDLVVVPREADVSMQTGALRFVMRQHQTRDVYRAMLSASPYPTAWDDVRKAYGELERERDDSIARETDAWRRANRAESKVKAWEGFVVVRDLPRLAVQTKYFGPGEQDTVSVPKITPEKLTDIINRAAAAEARIAELEKRLADAERVIEPCLNLLDGLVAESGREVGYGEEDAFRRGEWFEKHDLDMIRAARAYMEGK